MTTNLASGSRALASPAIKEAHPIREMMVRRGLLGLVTICVISIVVYAATIVLPGDAATAILGHSATPERLALLRRQLGLDEPLLSRFFKWAGGAVHGDFGQSVSHGKSVLSLLGPRIANSAVLVAVAAIVSSAIGMLFGMYAAFRRDGLFDTVGSVASLIANAIPDFVVAIFMVMLFSVNVFHLFPGVSILPEGAHIWQEPDKMILPALSLVIVTAPYVFRMTRGAMIEALRSDYIESARLRGIGGARLAFRHAFPNALPPIIQVVGLNVLYLAGGIVLVESVFNFPGVGSALVEAVNGRDVPVIQCIVVLLAVLYVVLNILTDAAVMVVTPRKRYPR